MFKYIFPTFFFFFYIISHGQTLTKPSPYEIDHAPRWAQLLYVDNPNYFQVEKEYQNYYKHHEYKKDMHVRYYRSWKKLFLNSINKDGFIDYNQPSETNSLA